MTEMLPTIVFFPGGFAHPSCFDDVASQFQKTGYSTAYFENPSLNAPDPDAVSTALDSDSARQVLLSLFDEGKDVVVFAHSYGGIASGAAAAGLSKKARCKNGEQGGVVGLIYVAANIAKEGTSVLEGVGGAWPAFGKVDHPRKGFMVLDPVMPTLYNDVDLKEAPKLEAAMIPHAYRAFETPTGKQAWAEKEFDGRRTYIYTTEDQTLPFALQTAWIEGSGVAWDTRNISSSHCPFISRPDELFSIALDVIRGWN